MAVNVIVPFMTRLLLENDRVRVYEFDLKPGEKTELHEHPDFVLYPLNDAVVRITPKGGQGRDVEMKSGEPKFMPAQWHIAENTGRREARALVIDLKK